MNEKSINKSINELEKTIVPWFDANKLPDGEFGFEQEAVDEKGGKLSASYFRGALAGIKPRPVEFAVEKVSVDGKNVFSYKIDETTKKITVKRVHNGEEFVAEHYLKEQVYYEEYANRMTQKATEIAREICHRDIE